MRLSMALCALMALAGCDMLTQAADEVGAKSAGGENRLSSEGADGTAGGMQFQGEFAFGGKTWTPDECVKAELEGMQGMIFLNETEGFALAVWTSGVPEGESNVWVADMSQPPPPDDDFTVGKGRCGKVKAKDGELIAGATKVTCGEGATGELRFRNCPDATAGAAAASVKGWPPK